MSLREIAVSVLVLTGACSFDTGGIGGSAASQDGSGGSDSAMTTAAATATSTTAGSGGTTVTTATTTTSAGPGTTTAVVSDTDASTTSEATDTTEGSTGEPQLPRGPFGPGVSIAELNAPGAYDDDPTLRGDLLEIFFNSDRTGVSEIWTATRASVDDPWDPPFIAAALSDGGAADTTPELSLDGLTMLLSSNRLPSAGFDVWMSERASVDGLWSPPVHLAGLSSDANDFGAVIHDATTLFVCTNRPGGPGMLDVWLVDTFDLGVPSFGSATLVDWISTSGSDCTSTISADGLEILWESTRPGGPGEWDLWTATRRVDTDPFSDEHQLDTLNTEGSDNDPWLSPDAHQLYYAVEFGGDSELYMAER